MTHNYVTSTIYFAIALVTLLLLIVPIHSMVVTDEAIPPEDSTTINSPPAVNVRDNGLPERAENTLLYYNLIYGKNFESPIQAIENAFADQASETIYRAIPSPVSLGKIGMTNAGKMILVTASPKGGMSAERLYEYDPIARSVKDTKHNVLSHNFIVSTDRNSIVTIAVNSEVPFQHVGVGIHDDQLLVIRTDSWTSAVIYDAETPGETFFAECGMGCGFDVEWLDNNNIQAKLYSNRNNKFDISAELIFVRELTLAI